MAKLNIYVGSQAGQTQSQFGKVKDSDKIFFVNQDPAATLTVTIKGEQGSQSALCKPNGQGVDSFTVAPTERSKGFTICDGYQGATFKYTAQVGTAAAEDPIIIIERWSIANATVSLTTTAVLTVAGLIVGGFVSRWLAKRPASPG